MKERQILFSGPMVRAILDGSKTQTRRLQGLNLINECPCDWEFSGQVDDEFGWCFNQISKSNAPNECQGLAIKCPYGVVGDRLWVKETWGVLDHAEHDVAYKADRHIQRFLDGIPGAAWFEADWRKVINTKKDRWRPSIFMPHWASRITLEITELRVQRLQDISEDDARAEGVAQGFLFPTDPMTASVTPSFRKEFARAWESINHKKHPWESNPWVWAISFKRVVE